jgi:A/G-specific adenine glycosylase
MLQQTQVTRVIEKYNQWLEVFPDIQTLANASLSLALTQWLGLGYNRRAKFLHESAKQLSGMTYFPNTHAELIKLPGVGVNTAGAILAYAFNQPTIFIETNIRTVYMYHFFENQEQVTDAELIAHIKSTIDYEHPREWYWALMDYGSFLKQTKGNFAKNSKHHVKQSAFEGSKRQIRGKVLAILASDNKVHKADIFETINDDRLERVLFDLQSEGLITQKQGTFSLAE